MFFIDMDLCAILEGLTDAGCCNSLTEPVKGAALSGLCCGKDWG